MKKKVGFWFSVTEPQLPVPISNGPYHGKEEFLLALQNLESTLVPNIYKGFSLCRICGKPNGNCEYEFKGFRWPSGYLHYLKDHNVKPDTDFKRMVECEM